MPTNTNAPEDRPTSKTIEEWCRAHRLSRQTFYNLKAAGKAPRHMKIGSAIRITDEADRAWQAEREAEAANDLAAA